MGSGVENGIGYLVASYVITWLVLAVMLARAVSSVRRARSEYESAMKGGFRT
jgi:hypothetical protein